MMATKNPFQGDDYDFFEAARGEDGGIKKEAPKKQTFSQAFAAARRSGDKTFMFNGKKFSTARADDKPAVKAVAPTKSRDEMATASRRAGQENMRAIQASRAKRAADSKKAADATSTARDKMAGESRLATKREREFQNMQRGEFPSVSNSRGNRKELETGPFKAGGKVKKYAEGGSVRGYGIARGGKKCKMV
jgi:hypothetical protein